MGNSTHSGLPSKTLVRHLHAFLPVGDGLILDVGCGLGRNAVALASHGASVVCVDRDLSRLRVLASAVPRHVSPQTVASSARGSIFPVCAEVDEATWPFVHNKFAAIICVHFLNFRLFRHFAEALVAGGYLYIETFENRGGNYLDLPRAGELRDLLAQHFSIQFYSERKAGPSERDAVTAKVLSKRI
jgi:SAM-dependent methyltransferase